MRASLDHLVFSLAEANPIYAGKMLPATVEKNSEFPIFGARAWTAAARDKRIGGIVPAAQTVIESLQPYNRGQRYKHHPLWVLYDLANSDKHRSLHVALAAVTRANVSVYAGYTDKVWSRGLGPVVKGAELMRWKVRPTEDDEMDVRFNLGLGIAFDKGTPIVGEKPVLETLDRIGQFIKNEVFPGLIPFLT